MGWNIESFKFTVGIQSLMAPFFNVRCVLVEREFIVSPRYLKLSTVSTVSLMMRMGGWDDGVPIVILLFWIY